MKKIILFDMDGTVYLGDKLFDGVLETFDYLKRNDIEFVFITNNSSKDVNEYIKKVNRLGIISDSHNFYTSVETTIKTLHQRNIKRIFVIANKVFKDKLEKEFEIVSNFDVNERIDAVVAGFSTEIVYKELRDAALFLENGVDTFIATNPDLRCPIEDGFYIPDCGSICEALYLTTGKKAEFLGKPKPDMILAVLEKFNMQKEDALVIGDRLYTDIKSGNNAGVETIAVLSGEINQHDIDISEDKPTYVMDSIKSLPDFLEGNIDKYRYN